jgi:hypothetical protein
MCYIFKLVYWLSASRQGLGIGPIPIPEMNPTSQSQDFCKYFNPNPHKRLHFYYKHINGENYT